MLVGGNLARFDVSSDNGVGRKPPFFMLWNRQADRYYIAKWLGLLALEMWIGGHFCLLFCRVRHTLTVLTAECRLGLIDLALQSVTSGQKRLAMVALARVNTRRKVRCRGYTAVFCQCNNMNLTSCS